MAGQIATYREFWPYYLGEHARAETRAWHIAGTLAATSCLLAALVIRDPLFLLVALIAGYGPAWFVHFFVEKNRPATFTYPLWSLISDFRMSALWLSGKLGEELRKSGL